MSMAEDEILVEFAQSGAYVKVTAIDPATGTEVSIVGDAAAPRDYLATLAIRKLQQGASPGAAPASANPVAKGKGGILV